MPRTPETISLADLRQDSAKVLEIVHGSEQPLVITDRGRAAAVILSIDEYERAERERELLLLLARGEKEIAEGRGNDLNRMLAEADALLAGGPA